MNSFFAIALVLTTSVFRTFVEGCGGCPSGGGAAPVHGGWGAWIPHGWPANPCSGSTNNAHRNCDSPAPANGGHPCRGSSTASVDCNECMLNNGGCDHQCINIIGGKNCECYPGYKRNNTRCIVITCATSGWPPPGNGSSSCSGLSEVRSGTSCTVTCNRGYSIHGPPSSRCDDDGKWYPKTTPNCQVKRCTRLTTPEKGDITPEICKANPLHGQKCSYKCDPGYRRVGPISNTCDNGDWTQVGFYCEDKEAPSFGDTCPSPKAVYADKGKTTSMVTWGPVTATDNDAAPIQVTQLPGVTSPHEFAEGSHTVIYTAKDASQNTNFCYFQVNVQVLRCPLFIPPENGRLVSGLCRNVFGSVCRLKCNKGYKLIGSTVSTCDKIPSTNQVQWTANSTICEAVECPSLNTPDHAVKTGYGCSGPTSRFGTACFLNCMLGYETAGGSMQRTCQENKKWSGTQLQCKAVKCVATAAKSEGLVINPPACAKAGALLEYKTECRFTCRRGYQLQGPGLKTCAQTKNWVPIGNPFCLDVSGPVFSNCPSNIVATADRETMSATVRWAPPSATDNSGSSPKVTLPRKRPGEKFFSGEHFIRYRATDKTGNVGECKFNILVRVVRCEPRLHAPAGGTKLCTKDNIYGSECSFTCHIGYTMVGSAKRVCEKNTATSTGFWTGKETKCELVHCPRLQSPPHSTQSGCGIGSTHNVFGDKCLLYCDIGYQKINGTTERSCQADGTWSGQAPYCKVVRCQSLQAPDNGHVSPSSCTLSPKYGTTCHFSCRKGYRMYGEPIASCLSGGEWSQNTRRFCKDVENPSFGLTCPSGIKRFADRGKKYTKVTWPSVITTDNSGVTPSVTTIGKKSVYYEGTHLVIYNASDEEGNYKICKFHVNVLVLRCQTVLPPLNGFFVGDCEESYGSTCRVNCDPGYKLLGAESLICEAKPGHITGYWDKPTPVCTVRRCPPLKAPVFGSIYPHMCTSAPISGTTCYFECSHGFIDDGGTNKTDCGNDGKWTTVQSEILKCVDVTPPLFLSCPSDIRASLSADSSALITWKVPVALDNSNMAPQITVLPSGVTPPHKFHNDTLIVYTAKDKSGNEEDCSFKVLLEDNIGPEVVYCPPDQNVSVTKIKSVINWKSPQFKDNSNDPLVISCSHKSGTAFYWGTWNVLCTAHDNNPSNKPAVCRFTLRLKPKDCKDLPPPKNGAKACDDWALGRMCSPFCNDQWDFTQRLPPFTIWSCGASGRWFPPMRWPDCTRVYQPNQARMAMNLYYYNGDCTTPKAQAQIKRNFIEILVGSVYRDICLDDVYKDKCKAENVKVTCALVPSVTTRKKRSLGFTGFAKVSNGTRKYLIPRTTISLDIVVRLEGTGTDETKESKVMAGLLGVKMANNISIAIKNAADEGTLNLTIDGAVFAADKESLNISEPERLCAAGQAYRDGYCVSCFPGTYYNKTLGVCEDCPVGTYQNRESQETCVLCPPGTSTEETRTYNRSGCIAMCRPGSYSPNGLEPCMLCAKGYFQQTKGQRSCLKCAGLATTTSQEGSKSSEQCGVPCPAGSFSLNGLTPCSLCGQRFFQSQNESRACVPCPGTTVADKLGSKSIQDCKELNKCESNPCKGNFACINLIDDFLCTCLPGFTGKQCEANIDDCQDQPCFNNGTCHDLVNNYTCVCAQGYKGFNCEDDIDECISSPCSSNALCSNIIGGYECQCKPGYSGRLCDTEIDECLESPCQNGATCRDGVNNYKCLCAAGYQGHDCEEDIDDCSSDPCENEATCVDGIASYHCICPAGFKGRHCQHNIDECVHAECMNNATCLDQVNGFYCVCLEGFSGKACEINIDDCASDPCMNRARCEDGNNGYSCYCQDGFDGLHCENNIDDCTSNPCSNNGSCHDNVNNFTCVCLPGFTGKTCSLDIDYCASMPCFNNASCFDGLSSFSCQCQEGFSGRQCQHNIDDCLDASCSNGGTCIDGIDEYACLCSPGFTGFNCETNINECAQNPCLNDGICTDLINDFQCSCTNGYTGRNCSFDINECSSSPCHNNGTCFDEVNSYTCACIDGFSGLNCEVDIDDCLAHSCVSDSTCKDGINSYTCICPPGYNGEYCDGEVNECESFPCLYGGTCYDEVNAFHCACQTGFTGQRCEVNIDDCQFNLCANNGTCSDQVADYTCLCPNGYTGDHCENRIDHCRDITCSQNGVCENLFTGFRCNCSDGFFGKYCEFEVDECLVGPCFNNGSCLDGKNNFICSCVEGFTGKYCELNVDDCVNNACQNNATCVDHTLGYTCLCAEGYSGSYCEKEINECELDPCENNGTCTNQKPGYQCRCLDRYTGENCGNLIDVCLSSPCQNGGTCLADNSIGRFTCFCITGFTGVTCDININDCDPDPCMLNSYCVDLVNGYECKCFPSYTGDHCDILLGSNFDLIFKRQTTSDMVILSDGDNIPNMRSFTIAMYVKANSAHQSATLFSYSVPNNPNDTIILSFMESQIILTIKNNAVKAGFQLADDHWHFLGVVWDGIVGHLSIYIDGVEMEKTANTLRGEIITGGGWIVVGQRYLAGENTSVLSTAFVGTMHQVNLWSVPGHPDLMWMGAHNCTWVAGGSVLGWSSLLFGIKGNVEKRFMTQCKPKVSLDMCTSNCSHFKHCESRQGLYSCICQAGFTGDHCNINIDECSSSPCVNGRCVDGVNRYDCVCNQGYWGTNCENKIEYKGECPTLPDPLNGEKSCKHFSGKVDCTMACNEGYTYDSEALTTYECGPHTGWKWNNMEYYHVPACSSKAAPKEIKHHFLVGFRPIRCEVGRRLSSFRTAMEEVVTDTLSAIPGCRYFGACKLNKVEISGCTRTPSQKKKRAVTEEKNVLLSLSVKAIDSAPLTDDVEERSEAVLFHMQYAVSTGQFNISLNGVKSAANRSSLHHLSSVVTCKPGFVISSDGKGCVACSVGTFYWQTSATCVACSRGTYQDEEGQLNCKPCDEGKTSYYDGALSRDECIQDRGDL